MPTIENIATVQRSLFDVFKLAGDFTRWPEWQPDVTDVHVTSGDPIRPGTMVAMQRRFNGRVIPINFDVLDYQRNKLIELTGIHGRFPYRRTIEFSSASGATTIKDKIVVHVPLLFFWYGPFLSGGIRRYVQADWERLAQMVASGGGVTPRPGS